MLWVGTKAIPGCLGCGKCGNAGMCVYDEIRRQAGIVFDADVPHAWRRGYGVSNSSGVVQ